MDARSYRGGLRRTPRRVIALVAAAAAAFVPGLTASAGSGELRARAGESVYPAAWSREGEILFTRVDPGGRAATIYTIAARGGSARQLGDGVAADWSPDGTRILFTPSFQGWLSIMHDDESRKRSLDVYGSEPSWD